MSIGCKTCNFIKVCLFFFMSHLEVLKKKEREKIRIYLVLSLSPFFFFSVLPWDSHCLYCYQKTRYREHSMEISWFHAHIWSIRLKDDTWSRSMKNVGECLMWCKEGTFYFPNNKFINFLMKCHLYQLSSADEHKLILIAILWQL